MHCSIRLPTGINLITPIEVHILRTPTKALLLILQYQDHSNLASYSLSRTTEGLVCGVQEPCLCVCDEGGGVNPRAQWRAVLECYHEALAIYIHIYWRLPIHWMTACSHILIQDGAKRAFGTQLQNCAKDFCRELLEVERRPNGGGATRTLLASPCESKTLSSEKTRTQVKIFAENDLF